MKLLRVLAAPALEERGRRGAPGEPKAQVDLTGGELV
jgi:hypothetical protein